MGGRSKLAVAGLILLVAGAAVAGWLGRLPPDELLAGALVGAGIAVAMIAVFGRPVTVPATPVTAPPPPPLAGELGLDALLAAVADPLLLVEGRQVTKANEAALRVLGAHVVGEDVRLAIRHPAAAELLARSDDAKAGEIEIAGLGGSDRYYALSVQPLGYGRRLVRLTDRSEHRAAERMRVDFVANASHELRTPLASVIGFIETLEDANGPADAAVRLRFLGIMAGEARRMQRLVDDLISLSRIEAERHRAPSDAVALGQLVHEAVDAVASPGRVVIEEADGLPAVAGDRPQLSQLVVNLIGNALKYGNPAEPVRVGLDRGLGGAVRLVVADRGDGIAPEHLPRLTERFYRVDPGRSRAAGGTGLGLAIVKHIVERHRGRLDIASEVGVGTRVTVLLPAVREVAAGGAQEGTSAAPRAA